MEDALLRAAGLMIVTPRGDGLFLRYAPYHGHGGEWGFPAGGLENGETPDIAAIRETREETGWIPNEAIKEIDATQDEIDFTTFATVTGNQFIPELSDEHDSWCWAPLSNPPEPLHPGVAKTLKWLIDTDEMWDVIGEDESDAEWFILRGIDPNDPDAAAYKKAVQRDGNVGSFKAWKQRVLGTREAQDAYGANAATKSELRNTIKFPPDKAPEASRAINIAYANGGTTGSGAKQSVQANKFINSGGVTEKDRERTGRQHAVLGADMEDIIFEKYPYDIRRATKKGFEVFKFQGTHSVKVATIGYEGQAGLDRAKAEIERRIRNDIAGKDKTVGTTSGGKHFFDEKRYATLRQRRRASAHG